MEHGRTCGIWIDVLVYCMQPHGGAVGWQCMRYIPVGDGIQQHGGQGGIWLLLCVYQYTDCMATGQHGIPPVQDSNSRKAARYTNATRSIFVYDIRTQYTTAITRASKRPGACITCACACARILLYYYIIIIL